MLTYDTYLSVSLPFRPRVRLPVSFCCHADAVTVRGIDIAEDIYKKCYGKYITHCFISS